MHVVHIRTCRQNTQIYYIKYINLREREELAGKIPAPFVWDIWKGLKRTAPDLEVVNFMALAGPLALWGEEPQGFNCLPKVSGATGSGLQGLARFFFWLF